MSAAIRVLAKYDLALSPIAGRHGSNVARISTQSQRRAARELVAAYHESQLSQLIEHVGKAVDGFRTGEHDAFDMDQIMFQYSRAAKELWKFCNRSDVEFTASLINEGAPIVWWERGAPRGR